MPKTPNHTGQRFAPEFVPPRPTWAPTRGARARRARARSGWGAPVATSISPAILRQRRWLRGNLNRAHPAPAAPRFRRPYTPLRAGRRGYVARRRAPGAGPPSARYQDETDWTP